MEGKVVLVTGSTSGIGHAAAAMFLSRGHDVIVTGLGDQKLIDDIMDNFSKLKGKATFVPVDLRDVESIHTFCQKVDEIYPNGIDVLFNNAGIVHVDGIDVFPDGKWDDMIAIMLSAPFHLIKHFLPAMRKKGWGRIINMSSQLGLGISMIGRSAYSAAKTGIIGLTKAVALEAAEFGVTCNAICPGFCNTGMSSRLFETKAKEWGVPFQQAKERFVKEGHPTGKATEVSQVDYVYKANQNNGIEAFTIVINASTVVWLFICNKLSITDCAGTRNVPSMCKLFSRRTPFCGGKWAGNGLHLVSVFLWSG